VQGIEETGSSPLTGMATLRFDYGRIRKQAGTSVPYPQANVGDSPALAGAASPQGGSAGGAITEESGALPVR